MLKRLLDITAASLALLLLSPALIMIGVWVRLDSTGPALFHQKRVGLHGRHFNIYKFRTMNASLEQQGAAITVGKDPRITKAGHWLRHSKLDELPQLFNVLRGDMSLVGPRPEVPHYVELYPASIRQIVLSVRPGITDPASIAFRNESSLLAVSTNPERTYIEEILPIKLQYAMKYVQSQSFIKDLAILLKTLWVIVRPPQSPH